MINVIKKAALAAAIVLAVLFVAAADRLPNRTEAAVFPEPVTLTGEYSVDGGPWRPLTEDTIFDNRRRHTTTLRGHFSREIREGQSLLLYIRNLYLTLKIDGRDVYRFGDMDKPKFFHTPGITLSEVELGRVGTEADVEIVITDAFRNTIPNIRALLDALALGDRAQLYERLIQVDGPLIFGSMCSALLGLFTLLLALISKVLHIPYASKSAALGFFAFATGLWFLYSIDHSFLPLLIARPQLAAANDILSLFVMSLAGAALIHCFVEPEYKQYSVIPAIGVYAGQAALFALQLLGAVQLYEAQALSLVFMLLVASEYVILAVGAIRLNRAESKLAAVCLIPATLGGLAECIKYFIFSAPNSYFLSTVGFTTTYILLLLLVVYQMKKSNDAILRAHKLEKDLAESRISIMLSQIQPHFLYNSLTGIKQLCDVDPGRASDALEHFAYFLRGNLNSLSNRALIPFQKELTHVQDYLYLEKMRFGDKLRIHMDIGVTDFMLPPLTLQPLVENAVRHGIMKKKEGGTVTVGSRKSEEEIWVTIKDDGAGFDMSVPSEAGRIHVGIANVRNRLTMQCGGSLLIKSEQGAGTEVTVILPQERVQP